MPERTLKQITLDMIGLRMPRDFLSIINTVNHPQHPKAPRFPPRADDPRPRSHSAPLPYHKGRQHDEDELMYYKMMANHLQADVNNQAEHIEALEAIVERATATMDKDERRIVRLKLDLDEQVQDHKAIVESYETRMREQDETIKRLEMYLEDEREDPDQDLQRNNWLEKRLQERAKELKDETKHGRCLEGDVEEQLQNVKRLESELAEQREEFEAERREWEEEFERLARTNTVLNEAWRLGIAFLIERRWIGRFRRWLRLRTISRALKNLGGWPA